MAGRDTTRVVPLGRPHAEFHAGFLWVALAAAIFGGFAIGGHLSFVIGFGYPLGASFPALVQAHGHAQLIGWAGLFVMGVSLHFIPRLASVPLPHHRWVGAIPWLMGIGLLLRTFGQAALPYLGGGPAFPALLWLVAGSGVLEGAGILVYLLLLVHTLRGGPRRAAGLCRRAAVLRHDGGRMAPVCGRQLPPAARHGASRAGRGEPGLG